MTFQSVNHPRLFWSFPMNQSQEKIGPHSNQFETNPVKSPVLMLNSPLVDWLTSHRVSTELRSSMNLQGELSNFTAVGLSSVLGYPLAV